jgi:hypothetical protein
LDENGTKDGKDDAVWWRGSSFTGYPAAGKNTLEAERERISAEGKWNSDS